MATVTLTHPGLGPLELTPENGYRVRVLSRTQAPARAVVEDTPDADGQLDTSEYNSAAAITLGIRLLPGDNLAPIWQRERWLKAFTGANRRPTAILDEGEGAPILQAGLARGIVDGPIERPTHRDLIAQWSIPTGIWESLEPAETTILGGPPAALPGLEFAPTLEFASTLEFPTYAAPGTTTATNLGDRRAYPHLIAYGPFGAAAGVSATTVIGNATTGRYLVFEGLQLLAGEFLEIDTRAHTVLLNGTQSLYDKLVQQQWWWLEPGDNTIVFQPETYSGVAQMTATWHHAYS